MHVETKRQLLHIGLLGLAFTLRWLDRWQAAFLLLAFLVVISTALPRSRLRLHFYRPSDGKFSRGAIMYFLTLLVLLMLFPPAVVAGSWAILALGDGTATLIGRYFHSFSLPWNRRKTYLGSLSFVFFGTIGCVVLLHWMLPDLDPSTVGSIALRATLVAALVESLPWKLDDNATVLLSSAAALQLML